MKTNLFIAALSLVVLAGCSSEDEIGTLVAKSDNAINFTTYVGKQTKAIDKTDFAEGDAFGVFAFYTGATDYNNTTKANFMYEQAITKGASGWTYNPLKYWPNTSGEKITFLAYYPSAKTGMTFYKAGTTDTYTNAITGFPDIKFVVQGAAADQVDFMYSTLLNQTKTESGSTTFNFAHALSKVNIKAQMETTLDDNTTVTIKSVTLNNIYSTNTLAYTTTWAWGSANELANYSTNISDIKFDKASGTNATNITSKNTGFLMVPQKLSTATTNANISVTYDVTTADTNLASSSTITNTVSADISTLDPATWEMNKQYVYTIKISLTDVSVAADITKWDTSEVTPTEKK